jgi:hypothetical protein
VHRGAAAAGASSQHFLSRFLIVYRQATISLAGVAIDPANFLLANGSLSAGDLK